MSRRIKGKLGKNPRPEDIRAVRTQAGLKQSEACQLVCATLSAWESWEQGTRPMHPGLWELFQIKTGIARS